MGSRPTAIGSVEPTVTRRTMSRRTLTPAHAATLRVLTLVLCAAPLSAQTARTTTRLNLRPTPDTTHTPLRVLPRGAELVLLAPRQRQGFYHVLFERGARQDTGWVASPYVRVIPVARTTAMSRSTIAATVEGLDAPATTIDADWEKQPIKHSTWKGVVGGADYSCKFAGDSSSTDPETNERKNRVDVPTSYHAVRFDAVADSATMPWPKGKTRPAWDKTAQGRTDRANFVTPYEGVAITITGFIRVIRPQANNSESTNCAAHGEANTDWHMALVGTFDAPETEAMVVEPTPRSKKAHGGRWTRARLARYENPQDSADSVRISGFLMLDPEHMNHMHKYRQTLWEIHPVTRIEVFVPGTGWTELDDLP
jgi:hypothetical protein